MSTHCFRLRQHCGSESPFDRASRLFSKPTTGPILDQYIGELMVLIINNNAGIKEPNTGYQNCDTSQIFIFDWYLKVRESL